MIWDAELLPIGWFDPDLVDQEPVPLAWAPKPVRACYTLVVPRVQSVLYTPASDVVVAAPVGVFPQVHSPVPKPAVSPRSVAVNVITTPAVVADAVVLPAQKVPQPQPVRVPRSVAFNPLAASPGVDDPFFISTQSQFAVANARIVPNPVGKSRVNNPMEVPPTPPVDWVASPVIPIIRSVGPPPRRAQSQVFNPLAASPGVDDPFFIRDVDVPKFVPPTVGKSLSKLPFIADAYVPPQVKPVQRIEQKNPQSHIQSVFPAPAVADAWVPPTIRPFRHVTTPKPQTVGYLPTVGIFEEQPWIVTVQLFDPSSKPLPNKQAKSRAYGTFTPNVAPNVILSPWIQSAQYAARIRAFKLYPSPSHWFPGGIFGGPTDSGLPPLEGRNTLGDLVGAGTGRGASGGAGGASGRGADSGVGSGSGRGAAGGVGAGTDRDTPGSVGSGGGRT